MRRGWKILIGVLVALAVLLVLNTIAVDNETKNAAVTVRGGRILGLPAGDVQVLDTGEPATALNPRQAPGQRAVEPPIVLLHCYTCAIDWWDRLTPLLTGAGHRVIAIDLLGHGGSEKPRSGYSIENQADLVAHALGELGVRDAEVVGHSLGGPIAIALAERSPQLVDRLVTIDSIPDGSYGDVGLIGELPFKPVIGEALWRIKPDFSIRDGLEVAFAPGFSVPDEFVEDVKRMTYSAYAGSHDAFDEYTGEQPLPERAAAVGKPLLAIMGAEEQIASDPREALAAYRRGDPGVQTKLIAGAGHSPNVEKPVQTARLVLAFGADEKPRGKRVSGRPTQDRLQNQAGVRSRP